MTELATSESAEKLRLLKYLKELGIEAPIVPYPAHTSVEEGKRLRGSMSGTFTKNLLLQDKKGNLFFVTAFEDTVINLKTFHATVGGHGRVGLARLETMAKILHVGPGTVTPLALMNDTENLVTLVMDAALSDAVQLNFHPMVHTESIGLTPDQFATFVDSCGKTAVVVALD